LKHFSLPSFTLYLKYGILLLLQEPHKLVWWRRVAQWTGELLRHGFTNADTWSLDCIIVRFVLPRLRLFVQYPDSVPMSVDSQEEWEGMLTEMVRGLELYLQDVCEGDLVNKKERNEMEEGMQLFKDYFENLWN